MIKVYLLCLTYCFHRKNHRGQASFIKDALPPNVHLLTVENHGKVENNQVIVRLENFYQSTDNNKQLAKPAQVTLSGIFPSLQVKTISKANLIAGNVSELVGHDVTIREQDILTYIFNVDRALVKKGNYVY